MKIGIIIHGPNMIDSGHALKIIGILKDFGSVYCRLGGTMGRTAVIDASLENLIDISAKRLPSESVKLFLDEGMDVIFLLNYGKSSVTGHTFGYKVFNRSFFNHGSLNENRVSNIPFIQIERPGESDGSIISWNSSDGSLSSDSDGSLSSDSNKSLYSNSNENLSLDLNESLSSDLCLKLSKLLNLNVLNPKLIIDNYFKRELVKKELENDLGASNLGEKVRYIHGVSPNENIFVNGIVVGKSNSENLSLISKDGQIVDIIGGEIKEHGIEKLGAVDINKAVVKTGLLRKTNPNPRILKDFKDFSSNEVENNHVKVAFLDHAAEDIYKLKNIDLVVTIGDDTTLVASDILYRFNVPVIGITDGDIDKVVENGYITKGSSIIELEPGLDDIVGKSIFKEVFNSKNYINLNIGSVENLDNVSINRLKTDKIKEFKKELIKIVNNITSEYIIKE
ncbi:hypothetical protein MBBAR_23c00190 [Methanobrevibacter arboriphilus JCM 13429 = DSM 1125]|uniref:DUF2117 domain-containing protein n=1 Tax=Methanobrevibacter arboriphilus JCM 13429 = DSM 1125 TaxID=1300164 RepID=A0A1V6N0U6_METAZ|nr:DUF2117 domain-containing protein [Methanobrevibacter arboriphilus]OQD58245.1 hypothetical protein MBBAR_23c00190 [Methanobrevibacter arboriphilus JCM 13429 = DSM 1125]